MKPFPLPTRALCIAAFLGLSCTLASAANPKNQKNDRPPTPPPPVAANVRVDVLMIAMPEEKYLTLLPDLLDKDKIEKAVPELLEAVKRKEMILEGYPFVIAKSGQRSVAETIKEVRYPTNSSPDQSVPETPAPQDSAPTPAPAATATSPTTPTSPAPPPAPDEGWTFETRNIGVTFEVEPVVSNDGRFIDLNLAPQHVQLLGFQNLPKAGDKEAAFSKDGKPATSMPLFFTMKDTTSITLRDGQHMFLSGHKSARPEGYVEVFIVHAEIIPTDK